MLQAGPASGRVRPRPLRRPAPVITSYSIHYTKLYELGVSNGGCLVLETATGRVLAYAGNVAGTKDEPWVDVIQGRRSTGSILKPLLYCAALEKGELLPDEMLPDIPLMLSGFNPKNFTNDFDGAVRNNFV